MATKIDGGDDPEPVAEARPGGARCRRRTRSPTTAGARRRGTGCSPIAFSQSYDSNRFSNRAPSPSAPRAHRSPPGARPDVSEAGLADDRWPTRRPVRYGPGVPTALLSVYDKSGVVELARGLADLGWTLVSSGGTAACHRRRRASPSPTSPTSPGVPAILGHRVVTLHPAVHAGILADLDDPAHRARPRARTGSSRSRSSSSTCTRSPPIPASS